MNFDYREAAKKNILIVAHRGVSAGNIPCNTLPAYEIALKQGADVIEMDVDMSADGELVVFHPGREFEHLSIAESFENATWDDISRYRYVNAGESSVPEKLTQFFRLFFKEFVTVAAQKAMNLRGIAVAKFPAQKSAFHQTTSL